MKISDFRYERSDVISCLVDGVKWNFDLDRIRYEARRYCQGRSFESDCRAVEIYLDHGLPYQL
jgi:hypothetical protein